MIGDPTAWERFGPLTRTAADAAGQWSGNFSGTTDTDGGVPEVATGTFYSEYGTAGKMVGAFGVNKQ